MGLIAIEGLQFYAHHGYYREEQTLGGQYTVDVYMKADLSDASSTDDLDQTVNYEQVYTIVKQQMDINSKLIEHVCKRIIDAIANSQTNLKHIKVRVSKVSPPLKANVNRVYVELEKEI